MTAAARPLGWGRSLLFASGDFGCNLYWQSITFYLLFFYTDTLGLSAAAAGLITMAASIWDGVAGLAIGMAADRRSSRAFVRWNAAPLALAFVLLYLPLRLPGAWLAVFALIAHMLFRNLYVAVNVPYAALTVRIAPDSASRSRIAGLRMILGAAAALVVAVGTQGFVGLVPRFGYATAAVPFGLIATVILFIVAGMPGAVPVAAAEHVPLRIREIWAAIAGNRALARLNIGICGAVAAMAVLTRAVPYYFKYEVGDAAAGSATLAMMSVAGVAVTPLWMLCAARFGHRAQWQISAATAGAAALGLLIARPISIPGAQTAFILFQVGGQGLFFGFWALIPDVVEHGGKPGAPRMDALLFAVAALLQKVALGVAVAIFGVLLSADGYSARPIQPADVGHALAVLTAAFPLSCLLIASAAMARFPRSLRAAA